MPRNKLSRVHSLSGGKPLSSAAALAGMCGLEKEIVAASGREWVRQLDATKRLNKICAPLIKIIRDDPTSRDHTLHARPLGNRKRRLPRPITRKEKERIYLGSLGALVPPPTISRGFLRAAGMLVK